MTPTDRRRFGRAALLVVAAVAGMALPSCSRGPTRPPLHPVHGTVTVRGEPAAKAVVVLRPAGGKTDLPHAEVGEDGTFRIGTYVENDGAAAGEYAVTITWPEVKKDPVTGDELVQDRLQGRFDAPEKSKLKATVKDDDNALEPFQLD